MEQMLRNVEKEINKISEKGLTSSNLEAAGKLIDIYKDIKQSKYYDSQMNGNYSERGRDGRYQDRGMNSSSSGNRYNDGDWSASGRYNDYGYHDNRMDRYFTRMRDGMDSYSYGRDRYRNGDTQERMVDGMEMIMSAVCSFVEELSDFAETNQEKEIIRKHLNKMKNI